MQVRALISSHPDYFPLYTEDGKWQHGREAWTNWCEGFLGGMMWIFAAAAAISTGASEPSTTRCSSKSASTIPASTTWGSSSGQPGSDGST